MMRRLVSPFILDKFSESDHNGTLEAAGLFVDAAGFTSMMGALTEHGQHGAEVAAQVMSALWAPLVEAVYAHRGVITVFAGDAFTAMFPADDTVADEQCVLRALAAATAMRRHVLGESRYETPWGAFNVGVKIGLAVGSVEWSILCQSPSGRAAFYVRGSAIDGCAATDEHNQPGGLVLHPSCRRLLHGAVLVSELADGFADVSSVKVELPGALPIDLPPVEAEALAAFVPREITEQTEVGEYRHVVNVFINVLGDPDDAELLALTGVMWDLQASYGGQLNRIDFGDKGCNLLLYWGAPVSFENDVDRALNFLLDLQRESPRTLRAGVTSGVSHAGFVGSDLHAEFTCYGQGINLAARLMSTAPWGSIWLDDEVQRRAAARFVTSFVGDQRFKGFATAQAVHRLDDRRPDGARRFDGEMVGRRAEMEALAAFVRPTDDGEFAGVLLIHGEAGMGKSRLISEFLQSVEVGFPTHAVQHSQPRALLAPSDSIARTPFHPFRYWLRNYFARNPQAPERSNKAAFDERLDTLLADLPDDDLRRELDRARSVLGALVDLHWDGSPYSRLDSAGRYDSTLDAVTSLVLAESLRQPVLLVLEDVHWIDEGSAEVVRRIARAAGRIDPQLAAGRGRTSSFPIAVLATARQIDASLLGDDVEQHNLALTPFALDDLATLATLVLGRPPAADLLDLVAARADGNPFFADQLLRFLRDEGVLLSAGGRWSIDQAAIADAPLPADVKLIFVAQLDRLGRPALEVVQAAAVLGREFSHDELLELLARSGVQPPTVAQAVEAGQAAGIWFPVGSARHAFRHILLRDAAYDMQIRSRRAQMHHRAAGALEHIWVDDLPPHYGDIGHHFESASHLGIDEARSPATDYLTKAGIQAVTTFASAAAADLFTRALALTPDDDVDGRFVLLLEREGANDLRSDRAAQTHDIEALESLARRAERTDFLAEAAIRRAYIAADLADFSGALAASDNTLHLARLAGMPTLESTALRTGGAALRVMGRFDEALERFEQAIAVAQAEGLEYQEATAWTAWSSLSVRRGRWNAAVHALEQVVTTFERLDHVVRVAHTLAELGFALMAAGRLTEAEARCEQALALTREAGDRTGQLSPLCGLALIKLDRRNLGEANALADEAIAIADLIGNEHLGARARVIRGRGAMLVGDRDTAHRLLAESERAALQRFPDLLARTLMQRAALALFDEQPDEALALASAALDLSRAVDDRVDTVVAVLYRSLAHEALGRLSAAETGFREVISLELAIDAVAGRTWDSRAGLARLALAGGQLARAIVEVTPILDHLESWRLTGQRGHGLSQCDQPARVYRTVVQVLSIAGDRRADDIVYPAEVAASE